ncbi:MAG: type II secretion system F family protein [Alphaproteobacteria bacterium]
MVIAILTAACLILGCIALFGAFMASRKARRVVEHRVNLVRKAPRENPAETVLALPLTWVGRIGLGLRRVFVMRIPRQWGMRTNNGALFLIALLASAAMWLLTHAVFGFPYAVVAPLAAGIFILAPRACLQHEQNQMEKKFTNIFPDSIDMIVRILRAGLPITAAIRSVSREAMPPVDMVFGMLNEQMEIGVSLEEALEVVGGRIGLPDFRFFAVAVSLQSATGGNLATTLEILTDIMRKRRAVRLKMQAATAEVRLSAYVLGAMPFFVVGVLLIVNPVYLAPLIKDPRGNMIVGVAALCLLTAFVSMRQMMRGITRS